MTKGMPATCGWPPRVTCNRSFLGVHAVMFALLTALVVVVIVAALRDESDAVLDRVDPRLWPYLHH